MKRPLPRTRSLLVTLALLIAPSAFAQTPFTYQGKLESNGSALTGTVHIRLGLYAASTGLSALRQEVLPNVAVTGGLFTVTPATFTVADFPGSARWLQIEVSSDAGNTYTPLTPRQQVTHTPYSMYAVQAGTASSVSGNVSGSQITGFMSPSRIDTGTATGTITFSPAIGAPFAVGNTTKVINLNTDLLDGLDATAFFRTTGGTLTGTLNIPNAGTILDFGSNTRQMINLWGSGDFGIGVQTATLYQRSNTNFAWFQGGVHSDAAMAPGGTGLSLMTLGDSLLMLRPNRANNFAGQGPIRVGFGDASGGDPYVWIGESDADDEMELRANKINLSTRTGATTNISFGQTTGQHVILYEGGGDTYGVGVQGNTEYFRTGDQFAWFKDGIHSDTAFNPGTGGSTLMTLGAGGELDVRGTSSGYGMLNRDDQTKRWVTYSRNSGLSDQLAFYSSTAGGDVASISSAGDLYLVGALTTTVLTIRGGADVAEPFDMSDPGEMEAGSVVVIDEQNPGKLKLSTEARDTRVAGIISGAGGVKPGLRLHQDGVMEGDHHVALSGRVYVKADALHGAIKPGDLLTTSENPGHAMKVTDHSESQGAILGKAMSSLDSGTGLVLVLVTLQ
ncbi:MAG: hypothetical protein V4584_07855 [Verrucomicrobiota bacterium]